ncbi:MAG TPA: class I SAM-dependent methyltransferase [bacterium]|nr:class I SAM-dependent methyltransferase [bacterium]HMZ04802.1 class I SAM-dependent methyltransferase [bacterium]HNB10221.1 class I SAM-dependent methyltransferase [bacterium]HNC49419.1 class I SAM-dependent methyltransferase [bacterium]HND77092.1 class I SAM-dependent methyltransferase [bacterium]
MDYLDYQYDPNDPALMAVTDELPFWSAPFGTELLNAIRFKPGMTVLDIGCGSGFPMLEIAERIGKKGTVWGIDPWPAAVARLREKTERLGITQVHIIEGQAEDATIGEHTCDLIVSNNGINNVSDIPKTLSTCRRSAKHGAQFVMTYNLEGTMRAFYDVLRAALRDHRREENLPLIDQHIRQKRPPLDRMEAWIEESGFEIGEIKLRQFHMDFTDGKAFFEHHLIRHWFLPSWKNLVPQEILRPVFTAMENRMNDIVADDDVFRIEIPFALIDATAI